MGKKKKKKKAAELRELRQDRLREICRSGCSPAGCKSKCCKKFKKGEHKRCSKCPCTDLLKLLKSDSGFQQVA
ncbi:hypothetical protein H7F20_04080 [Robiginitalea sp. SC105]|nr:hypothetical protein [Robiginitalea sp. SC105]